MSPCCFETVVVGVGNTMLSDDGVGARAARAVMRDRRLRPGIAVLGEGTLGLGLLEAIAEARHILFLDSVNCGVPPGTVVRISGDALLDSRRERTVHQLGIADLVTALAVVSSQTAEIVILGMQPANGYGAGLAPPAARAALAPLIDAAFDQLRTWQSKAKSGRRKYLHSGMISALP